jgi:tRNA nucleotidyltransferase (CCA-adding enzyme)
MPFHVFNANLMKLRLPRLVQELGNRLSDAGFQAYLVGGAVRNLLRGEKPADYDVTTDARPDQIEKLFRRVIPTGIKHGTVTVFYKNTPFEITTFRTESGYSDSRRPDSVHFVASLTTDLERRDFTINAIAVDACHGDITDPHDGRTDLKKRIIRAIGTPEDRFSEDGLRLIRACRFAAQLGFDVAAATLDGMRRSSENIRSVSPERIREETDKILKSALPSVGFKVMEETGILEKVFPDLARCRGVAQKGDHLFDVLDHSLYSCDGAPTDRLVVRLAALLHDIGKPAAKASLSDGTTIFHGHEQISADLAGEILRGLRYPKAVERLAVHLIKHHMFAYDPTWTDAAVRRFVKRVDPRHIDDLFALRMADGFGVRGCPPSGISVKELKRRIAKVIDSDQALTIKDLKVGGDALHEKAGIPKGPDMGLVFSFLMETVLDDPTQNEFETLIGLAKNYYDERIAPK